MMQGAYPFNEAAFRAVLRQGIKLGVLFALFIVTVAYAFMREAHADTNAEQVFGRWEKVTPETMLRPVPEWRYERESLGAVTNEYRKKVFADVPALPGRPQVSPRSAAPEQVAGLQSHLPERR